MSLAVKVARAASQGGIPVGRTVRGGDPGLFGFLKGVAKTGLSLVTGGPAAAAQTAARQLGLGRGQDRTAPPGPISFLVDPGAALPGGRPFIQTAASALGAGVAAKGFHLNKSDYFLRDGTFIAAGTRMVKNRRRNALNVKALRRAVGRIDAGKIWQGKLAEISTGKFTAAGKRKDHHHHHR